MTRIFTSSRCLEHVVPPGFPERPERLERVLEGLAAAGFELEEVTAWRGAERAVLRVHGAAYLERFRSAVERGDGLLDSADNPLCAGTWAAAWAAVEVALAAASWSARAGRAAFAAVRPPGHHAERATAMGFCYLNNAAVVAEFLRQEAGVERVAVFDFDVHHGNGTQHLFEERGDVLYVSTHQYPFYPGTGAADETGRGAGEGATVNVPLAARTGPEGFREALEERVLPALDAFAPAALVVSAGFDGWRGDPLGGLRLDRETFGLLGRTLAGCAARHCEGRLVAVLEGGYDVAALPELLGSFLVALEKGEESVAGLS